jgi:hypothetical protein
MRARHPRLVFLALSMVILAPPDSPSIPVTGSKILKTSAPARHSLCSTVFRYRPLLLASTLSFTTEWVVGGSGNEGERVGGVRERADSYAWEDRRDTLDRENVEDRRRERRVGVVAERRGESRPLTFRVGRPKDSGIVASDVWDS